MLELSRFLQVSRTPHEDSEKKETAAAAKFSSIGQNTIYCHTSLMVNKLLKKLKAFHLMLKNS